MKNLKVLELFGGIGACSKALERLNIEHEIVDYVEIDKYAVKSYNAIHGTNFEPQDITTWDKQLDIDLIMHGSPCQDFSLAGKQNGGDQGSGTRSSLLYETIRIVSKLKPKYVIWENVKNVLSQKHRHNFDNYLKEMEQLGYTNYYQVLNAKDYGIPQNRERVFTISILGEQNYKFPNKEVLTTLPIDYLEYNADNKYDLTDKNKEHYKRNFGSKGKELNLFEPIPTLTSAMGTGGGNVPYFAFPPKQDLKLRLKDMLEDEVDEKYYLSKALNMKLTTNYIQYSNSGKMQNGQAERLYFKDSLAPTLSSSNTNEDKSQIVELHKDEFKEYKSYITWKDNQGNYNTQCNRASKEDEVGLTVATIPGLSKVLIKEATKKGYKEAYDGDSVNLAYPESETRRGRVGEQVAQTLQCNDNMGVVEIPRIRKLTPKECWRLMGFDDEDFEKASQVNSNAQLYKQAGNSIVVNVLEAILTNLLKGNDNHGEKQLTIDDI